ncbi:VanZ family protein [Hydrogenophaga sp. OTU3427]|uniref:VanZ family protein n=1 Tax=Hydrogenophaga sp. OTU3427 TaxID=3043856 RepID=UPI00313CD064
MFRSASLLVWQRRWALLFGGLTLVTACLSLVPVQQLPSSIHFWDKAQHALGFAALGGVGLLAFPQRPLRLLGGLMLFGVVIELAQAATGWREGDWLDGMADGVGLAVGALAWLGARGWLSRAADRRPGA